MNFSLGLSNSQSSFGSSTKALPYQSIQNKLSKISKQSQSSKDLKILSHHKSVSTTPKSTKLSMSNTASPKSSSPYSKTSTPKSQATPTNLSSNHTYNKSWNVSPTPSSFRSQKCPTPSRFSQLVDQQNELASRLEDSRTDIDQAYLCNLKAFTEEEIVDHGQKSGRNSELNISLRQKVLMSPELKSKSPVLSKSSSTASMKNQAGNRTLNSSPFKSGFAGKGSKGDMKLGLKKTKSEDSNGFINKTAKESRKEYNFEAGYKTPQNLQTNNDMHVNLRDILRVGSKTPQPGSNQQHEKDQVKLLLKERDDDKKTIKFLQGQIARLEKLVDKSFAETKSSERSNTRDSPDFLANLTNCTKTSEIDIKQKEIMFLQIQNDTLKMTSDIFKKENEILKQNQSYLLQFKEAAKRYRDLANSKSSECLTLAEEVINLRKERGIISTSSSAQITQITLMNSDTSFSYTNGDRTPPSNRAKELFSPKGRLTSEVLLKSSRTSVLKQNFETEPSEADYQEVKQLPHPQEVCVKPLNKY